MSSCFTDSGNTGLVNGKDSKESSPSPNDKSRETTPSSRKSLDSVEVKKDPYGDLLKKVVKIKSRSNSPNKDDSGDQNSSRESTPKREVAKQDRNRQESSASRKAGCVGPSLRTKQVTFMLFIITVVFVLSFIPHLVLMVINSMDPGFVLGMTPAGIAVYNLFLRTFVINNMANPIIYGFCDKKFRKAVTKFMMGFLTCGRR